jgi:hypothetical protein
LQLGYLLVIVTQGQLPNDWEVLPANHVRGFEQVLRSELATGHRWNDVRLQAVARRGSNDDVLFRHMDEADLWSVVHLTWSNKQEQPPFPLVGFTGTFAEFHARYTALYQSIFGDDD